MTATGRQIDLAASTISATSGFDAQGFITAGGVSAIAGVSDFDATGRATFVGASTIAETSGFVAIGGLKWEDI
jgi:peroxiredoxin